MFGNKHSEPALKIGRKPIKSPAFDFVFMQR